MSRGRRYVEDLAALGEESPAFESSVLALATLASRVRADLPGPARATRATEPRARGARSEGPLLPLVEGLVRERDDALREVTALGGDLDAARARLARVTDLEELAAEVAAEVEGRLDASLAPSPTWRSVVDAVGGALTDLALVRDATRFEVLAIEESLRSSALVLGHASVAVAAAETLDLAHRSTPTAEHSRTNRERNRA